MTTYDLGTLLEHRTSLSSARASYGSIPVASGSIVVLSHP